MSFPPASLDEVDRRRRTAAGRQHRVDHQHVAVLEIVGQLRVVLRRQRRRFVPLDADVPNSGGREQVEHRVQHPESRTQDGHHDDITGHDVRCRRPERRGDRRLLAGTSRSASAARSMLIRLARPPEVGGQGVGIARMRQCVLNKGMSDYVKGHPRMVQGPLPQLQRPRADAVSAPPSIR